MKKCLHLKKTKPHWRRKPPKVIPWKKRRGAEYRDFLAAHQRSMEALRMLHDVTPEAPWDVEMELLGATPPVAGSVPDRTKRPSAASTITVVELRASSFTTQSVRDVSELVVVSNHGRRSRALQMRIISVLGGWSGRTLAIIFPNSIFSDGARTASPYLLSTSGLRFCCSARR
jgi:hypothetical protein